MTTLPEPAPYFPSAGKFRKKPVVIEARLYDGGNIKELMLWSGGEVRWRLDGEGACVDTLEGTMNVGIGDWVIKGIKDEFYPCKDDIFIATYEPV